MTAGNIPNVCFCQTVLWKYKNEAIELKSDYKNVAAMLIHSSLEKIHQIKYHLIQLKIKSIIQFQSLRRWINILQNQ